MAKPEMAEDGDLHIPLSSVTRLRQYVDATNFAHTPLFSGEIPGDALIIKRTGEVFYHTKDKDGDSELYPLPTNIFPKLGEE